MFNSYLDSMGTVANQFCWYVFAVSITFGSLFCALIEDGKYETFLFDKDAHGPKATLSDGGRLARRYEGYCWAVCLGDRQLKVNQSLHFNITEIETGWGDSSLNVGISYKAPDDYQLGDLVLCDANVTSDLPETRVFIFERFYSEDNVYTFRVDNDGFAHLTPNVTEDGIVFTDVDITKSLWVIFNLFGDAKAVELLGTT